MAEQESAVEQVDPKMALTELMESMGNQTISKRFSPEEIDTLKSMKLSDMNGVEMLSLVYYFLSRGRTTLKDFTSGITRKFKMEPSISPASFMPFSLNTIKFALKNAFLTALRAKYPNAQHFNLSMKYATIRGVKIPSFSGYTLTVMDKDMRVIGNQDVEADSITERLERLLSHFKTQTRGPTMPKGISINFKSLGFGTNYVKNKEAYFARVLEWVNEAKRALERVKKETDHPTDLVKKVLGQILVGQVLDKLRDVSKASTNEEFMQAFGTEDDLSKLIKGKIASLGLTGDDFEIAATLYTTVDQHLAKKFSHEFITALLRNVSGMHSVFKKSENLYPPEFKEMVYKAFGMVIPVESAGPASVESAGPEKKSEPAGGKTRGERRRRTRRHRSFRRAKYI